MPPRTTRLAPLLLLLAINACSSLVPRAAVPLRFCDATATRSVKANCAASYDDRGRRIIPFATAREAVQRLSLRDEQEWCRWVEDNKPGITSHRRWYLPDHPDEVYIEEWLSWDDWLGVMRPYDEAVRVVSALNITSQQQWWTFTSGEARLLQQLRVPAQPHIFYKEWGGYDEWLSLPETPLVLPRKYGQGGAAD
jgi:hypothetical protein